MAYQSLYRRYRPQRFEEVRGQDHVTRTLRNAVRTARVSHAYLFSGPRGTGKTSTARILAKALNCAAPEDGEPCGRCDACVEITEGRSLDVIELDAASNRGIDAMRELVARVSLGTPGRWKVYIVDEVHMLTTEAANTLLKTLEEPPGHVVFVLATTEPQKVLLTIRSRTQPFEFHLLPAAVLVDHLRWVAGEAGLDVAPEAIDLVARRGNGSARDALSALDQVAAAGGIDDEPPSSDEAVEALCERDAGQAVVFVAERCAAGHDPRQLTRELLEHLRRAFLATQSRGLVGLPDDDLAKVEAQARRLGPAAIVRSMEVLGDTLIAMRDAPDPRVLLEVALVRLCRPDVDVSPAAMLDRIERLERALAAGGVPPPAAGGAPPPTVATGAPPMPAAPEPAPAPAPSTAVGAGVGSPARAARQALGANRAGAAAKPRPATAGPAPQAPPMPGARPAAPAPPASPVPAPPAATPEPPAPSATSVAAREAAPPDTGPFPTRDDITLAWGDHVLAGLSRRAAVRCQVGRFIDASDGTAVFALPNAVHRDRCEEVRSEVEGALTSHFGRPVRLRLAVENEPGGPGPGVGSGSPAEPDDDVDLADLRDAPSGEVASPVDHVMQAFEGAKVVED